MKKEYDPVLHEKSRPAEKRVVEFLNTYKEVFGAAKHCGDVYPDKDATSSEFDFEVERRIGHWKSNQETFPYLTVTIPARKTQYIKPWTLYFVVRDDLNKALVFTGKDIINGKVIFKNTRYTENEKFMEIKREEGMYFDI